MSLSDQTLGFYLALDTERWDGATKKVLSDYKRFTDAVDKATTTISKKPQQSLDALAASLKGVASAASSVTSAMSAIRQQASGRAIRVPVELVFSKGGGRGSFQQLVTEAVGEALAGARVRMNPVVPDRGSRGFKTGVPRSAYAKIPTPAAMEGGFVTAHGTAKPVRRRAVPGPNPRMPMPYGTDQVPALLSGGEAVASRTMADLIEAMTRQAAVEGWGGVSTQMAVGAMRLRRSKKLGRAMAAHVGAQEDLQNLYMRRDLGEKVSKGDLDKAHDALENTLRSVNEVIDKIRDPTTKTAGKAFLRPLSDAVGDLHANAELAGTIFDPKHWTSLSRTSGPVMSKIAGWMANNPGGRLALGLGAIGWGAYGAYRNIGGLDSAMTLHGMTGQAARYAAGTQREVALDLASRSLSATGSLVTRADLAQGFSATIGAGLHMRDIAGASEYLAYANRGLGLDYGVGAENVGTVINRFSQELGVAKTMLGGFAAEARRSRISINQLGTVALEAADAASEADYRTGGGATRMMRAVTSHSAMTAFFGGGQAGARLAAPLTAMTTRLQQGDIGALQGGVMLFGNAAVDAVTGRANASDLARNLNYDFLRSLVGRSPLEIQHMAQLAGVPYPTLAALVGKVGAGKRITAADLSGRGIVDAKVATEQTTSFVERQRQMMASWVDSATAFAPDLAINVGHTHGLVGEAASLGRELLIGYGGTKLIGSMGRMMRGPAGSGGLATRLGGWGRAAGRAIWNPVTGLAATSALAGGLATAGGISAGGQGARIADYLTGRDGIAGLQAIAEGETGIGGRWRGFTNYFNDAYQTNVATTKQLVAARAQEAITQEFRFKAQQAGFDETAYLGMDDTKARIAESMAAVNARLAGVNTVAGVGDVAQKIAQERIDGMIESLQNPSERSAEYLRQIKELLQNQQGDR